MTTLRLSEAREARWLPSRCSFAFFRLLMIALLARSRPTPGRQGDRTTVYSIDRHQSSLENYTIAILLTMFITAWEYIALDSLVRLPPWLLFLLAPILVLAAPLIFLIVSFTTWFVLAALRRLGIRKGEVNHDIQSAVFLVLMTLAAVGAWFRGGLGTMAGLAWGALLLINGLAALTLLALEPRVRRLDEEFGGARSAASS
jgi:hypothetical protein